MKTRSLFRVTLVLLCAAAFFGCSPKKPPVAVPENTILFGFTEQGVFFVNDTLVQNIGAKTVRLKAQTSEFRPRDMERKGDLWVYDVSAHKEDSEMFKMYRTFPILYFFEGDNRLSIPNDLLKYKDLFDTDILRITNKDGYVFYTEPVERLP